jgi:uncharacterized membrane protein
MNGLPIDVPEGEKMGNQETFLCQVCGKYLDHSDIVPVEQVPDTIIDLIRKEYPSWSPGGSICRADLNRFRADYVRKVLEKERGDLARLEEDVALSMKDHELLLKNTNIEFDGQLSFGDRLADQFADFAGSWRFIGLFTVVFFLWIAMNSILLVVRPFDPYPFIFLNLVLSALAAIQAPVIIMSQNRQEERDRLHAERDFDVSIHSEMEIHQLHKKIDHLLINQGQRFLEIQQIQLELMEELGRKMQ